MKLLHFPLVLFFLFCCLPARANTITAISCAQADVQNAINSAAKGDHVVVPGGSCSWGSGVSIPASRYITLDGGGNTTIAGVLSFTASTLGETRVTGFTWTGTGSNANAISTSGCGGLSSCGGVVTSTWRIDHNTFNNTSVQAIFIQTFGNGPGLIDNNTLIGGAASEMIHNLGMGASDNSGWTDSVVPGSANMLFVENNTFTFPASGNPAYFWGTSAIQAYYGARTVVRYNTFNMAQVDQHGTCGLTGARWWEIYNNQFNTVANANQSNYMALRDGTGVVFNNHQTGPNLGGGVIELTQDCTSGSYPEPWQIGRGINQQLSPAYVWGNDASMQIQSGSSFVNAGTGYFVSASQPASMSRYELSTDTSSTTYSYVPYTYPHPLQGGVAPPTGLKAAVQ